MNIPFFYLTFSYQKRYTNVLCILSIVVLRNILNQKKSESAGHKIDQEMCGLCISAIFCK